MLLTDAFKRDCENRLWEQWLVDYGRMNSEDFMSFEDYKNRSVKVATTLDKQQILLDAELIKQADQGNRA